MGSSEVKQPGDWEGEITRQLVAHLREVFWMTDPEKTEMIYISPGYQEIWGRSCEDLYRSPRSWIDAIHPDDMERVVEAALTKQVGGEYDEEYRIIRPDGSIRWIRGRAFPVRNESGVVYRIAGISEDITKRKEMEAALRESEARFSGIISIAADAIIMVNEAQRIVLFNKGAEQVFGYQASEVIGQPLDLLLPLRAIETHGEYLRAFGASSETARFMGSRVCKISGRRKDGTEFPAEASIAKWSRNGETLYTAVLRDITERERAEEAIQHLAYFDPLTGLPNRTRFHEIAQRAILAGQYEGKPVAVLVMDLDRFKEINDTLGHHRGDFVLQQVGLRLKKALRPTDAIARLGGDEFGVVLPIAAPEDAFVVAQKLLKVMESPFDIEGLPINIEPSIGIAVYPDHGESADSLLQRADVAMYVSKRGGRGYTLYAPDLDRHSPRRLALLGELRRGIESGQLFLHYQPKVDLVLKRVVGVEALVRWQHPELGRVPPDRFIGPAEQTGLIGPLTQLVLKEALTQCQAWIQGGKRIPVAVNLSVRNLQDPRFPDQVAEMLQAFSVPPEFLEMEITESGIMADAETAMRTITRLSEMGISLAIDDFGIGYSSLSYLQRLRVDSIKIDRSFVMNMRVSEGDRTIVRATIDLAHNLGLKVVAEGVEDQETLEKLTSLGCDAAQGYHTCRPISAEEFARWASDSPWTPAWD